MMFLAAMGAIYGIGCVFFFLVLLRVTTSEPTAHGQEIILGIGLVLVVCWPLALVWALGVGIASAAALVWRKVRGRA